jgi:hypothetical protein
MTSNDTLDAIQDHAQAIISLAESLKPSAQPPLSTADQLNEALASCAEGATLVLAKTLVYHQPLTLPKSVTLQSETYAAAQTTRMTMSEPAPSFLSGIEARVDNYALLGLAISGTDTIGVVGGKGGVWDRCRLLGDTTLGAHRAFWWTGSQSFIRRCIVDDVFRPDQDTQAICGWDCDGAGLVVEDCGLNAAGQAIMFGGADAASSARIPKAIRITKSQLGKQPAWVGKYQCKCAFEVKCAIDVTMEGCDLQYGGINQGQGYYLIVVTPRNQDGGAPFTCITNVEIAHCTGSHASGVANMLGKDNVYPSGRLDGFNLHDCTFTDLDGSLGAGRVFLFGDSPAHVTLQNLRVTGKNHATLGFFYGAMPTGLVMGGLALPNSSWGWVIDNDGSGHDALQKAMPDAQLDATVV